MLPVQLLACLKQVAKIINFVKASALNTRLFKQLCDDLGSEHTSLLYHTEVRWLSHGNATKRLFEMKNEMLLLFKELGHPYSKDLENDEFVQKLAYLSDIFEAFNIVNLSLQGRNGIIVDFVSKLRCFHSKIRKLDLWKRNTENSQLGMFKCLSSLKMKLSFSEEIASHLASLKEELVQYFPEAASYVILEHDGKKVRKHWFNATLSFNIKLGLKHFGVYYRRITAYVIYCHLKFCIIAVSCTFRLSCS